ncbi:MAG: hypothetical protein KJ666_04335 [Bacteroidetes bacterium]|nr:hypothetical protein [Bacteroidota bacterium]MBU2586051.1 hypothetical protein [Bacteroidota bacterium]
MPHFDSLKFVPSSKLMRNLKLVIVIGISIFLIGLFFAPQRSWANLLLANYYLISLGLAGVLFIAFQFVSNAGWGTAIRRVPEAMSGVLIYSTGIMLIMLLGLHSLFEWTHKEVVAADSILQSKTFWLNEPFFIVRTILFLGLWILMASFLIKFSRKQDESGDVSLTKKSKRLSAGFIVVFALSFSFFSMDWIMSLEPHWFSTIFAVYNFSGLFLNGLAAITIVTILLRRMGPFQNVLTQKHLHNLGKLLFAFSTFWMYIWFSQYLLIWYANIPEEVTYFIRREEGSWAIFTVVNVLFNWVIPFVLLLPKRTKINEGLLFKICIIIMAGHWIDLYWMIMPPFMKSYPSFNIWEIGPMAASISAFFYLTFRTFAKGNIVPINDPYLVESLDHH